MNTNERRTIGYLRQLIKRWEDRLFASDDAWARERGLQITSRANGHGRRYRDPRWDLVIGCPECAGMCATGGLRCGTCDGVGTIRLDRSPIASWNA